MKCEICSRKIAQTFLQKVIGTYVKVNQKKHIVCNECQSHLGNSLKDKFA